MTNTKREYFPIAVVEGLKETATIHPSKRFRESALAHQLLDGMVGLDVGGSAHNDWGLRTINADYTDDMTTVFKKAEVEMCGEARAVDVVAFGDELPFQDKSFDFVVSSHVIEHFWDPIKSIKEWVRVATKYVFIICPQPDADPGDRGQLITGLQELVQRHSGEIPPPEVDDHRHWTRWTSGTFREMCAAYGWKVSHTEDPDAKVGNGFAVVIDLQSKLIL
jgi:SAM-dependent methyltransferase